MGVNDHVFSSTVKEAVLHHKSDDGAVGASKRYLVDEVAGAEEDLTDVASRLVPTG